MGFARVGSNPTVVDIFGDMCQGTVTVRIRGRVVKALRSGRSQLCWRGFESRRMQTIFVLSLRSSDSTISICSGGVVGYHVSLTH
jgi:hypothetical protein